jgi:hypothetical protein
MHAFTDQLPKDERRAIEALLKRPRSAWRPGGATDHGLEFELHLEVDTYRLQSEPLLQPLLAILPAHAQRSRLKVVIGSGRRSLETADEEGLHPRGYLQISDDRVGTLHVDRAGRSYLHTPPVEIAPGLPAQAWEFELQQAGEGKLGGRRVQNVRLVTTRPVGATWELAMCGDQDLRSFAEDVLCVAVGCPDNLKTVGMPAADLISMGVPVAGRIQLAAQFGADLQTFSTFRLEGITVRAVDSEEFGVPPDYRDLRDTYAVQPAAGRAPE